MEEIKETKKGGSNGVLILAILVILCLVGYICYDKVLAPADKTNTSASSETKKANNTKADTCDCDCEEETQEEISNVKRCDGEYYGEYKGENNGMTYNLKYTYYIHEDGTFSANISDVQGHVGQYVILDKTKIIFIHPSETGGDVNYSTEEMEMAEDCSYMMLDLSSGNKMKLERK